MDMIRLIYKNGKMQYYIFIACCLCFSCKETKMSFDDIFPVLQSNEFREMKIFFYRASEPDGRTRIFSYKNKTYVLKKNMFNEWKATRRGGEMGKDKTIEVESAFKNYLDKIRNLGVEATVITEKIKYFAVKVNKVDLKSIPHVPDKASKYKFIVFSTNSNSPYNPERCTDSFLLKEGWYYYFIK